MDSILPVKETYEVLCDGASKVYDGLSLVFPAIPGWVAGRRVDILTNTFRITQDKLDNCNLPKEQIKHCSLKLGVPWVENASLEEDPSLQELWANLLANALNPNFNEEIPTSFISIIKDLSPMDVRVINELQVQIKKKPKYAFGDGWSNIDYIAEFAKELKVDPNTIKISFENLFRLRLVDHIKIVNVLAAPHLNLHGEKQKNESAISNRYPYFTSLGESFIKACVDDAGNNKAKSSE